MRRSRPDEQVSWPSRYAAPGSVLCGCLLWGQRCARRDGQVQPPRRRQRHRGARAWTLPDGAAFLRVPLRAWIEAHHHADLWPRWAAPSGGEPWLSYAGSAASSAERRGTGSRRRRSHPMRQGPDDESLRWQGMRRNRSWPPLPVRGTVEPPGRSCRPTKCASPRSACLDRPPCATAPLGSSPQGSVTW